MLGMRSLKLFSETFMKREHGYRNEAFKWMCGGKMVDLVENKTTPLCYGKQFKLITFHVVGTNKPQIMKNDVRRVVAIHGLDN